MQEPVRTDGLDEFAPATRSPERMASAARSASRLALASPCMEQAGMGKYPEVQVRCEGGGR